MPTESRTRQAKSSWRMISEQMSRIMPPCRPSEEDSLNYGRLMAHVLRGMKRPRIMVMGSTPEIRRLTYTYSGARNGEVHCVDLSRDMYEAMSFLMHPEVRQTEKFHERSWISTGLPEDYFDLVLGDEVIYNVLPSEHVQLFTEISRVLKKNGWWITKHNAFPDNARPMNPKEILIYLARKIHAGECSFQRAYNELAVLTHYYVMKQSCDHGYRAKDSMLPLRKACKGRLSQSPYREITRELLRLYDKHFVSSLGTHVWSALSERESDKELRQYFKIVEKVYADDYVTTQFSPIYVLKKK